MAPAPDAVYNMVMHRGGWRPDLCELPLDSAGPISNVNMADVLWRATPSSVPADKRERAADSWARFGRAYLSSRLSLRPEGHNMAVLRGYEADDGDWGTGVCGVVCRAPRNRAGAHPGPTWLPSLVGVARRTAHDRYNTFRFIPHDHMDVLASAAMHASMADAAPSLLTGGRKRPRTTDKQRQDAALYEQCAQALIDDVPTDLLKPRLHRMAPLPGAGIVSWRQPHGSVELVAAILAQCSVLYPYAALSDVQLAWAGTLAGYLQLWAHDKYACETRKDLCQAALGCGWAEWAERIADFPVGGWLAVDRYRRVLLSWDGFARHYD